MIDPGKPDVQVPGVVLVMGDVDPVVVCDHPLVQAQDRLVTRLIGNIFEKHKIFLRFSLTLTHPTLKSLSLVTVQERTASLPR